MPFGSMFRISPGLVASFGFSGSQAAGATGSLAVAPNMAIAGPSTRYDMTAPAIIRDAIRGPIRNPTPSNSGASSPLTADPFRPDFAPVAVSTVYSLAAGSEAHNFAA